MTPRFLWPILVLFVSSSLLFAVSPLVTDDADTVEAGKLQLNCDFFFLRTSSTTLYSPSINPALGLNSRLEIGAIFGYQWRVDSGATARMRNGDAVTDLTIGPKVRVWEGFDDKLKFSARADLKLPTASRRDGLGTGDPDFQLIGIATCKLGRTNLDFNVGYQAIDISRAEFADDRWFVGEALRQELSKKWTAFAEVYAVLPSTRAGGYATWFFSAGPQWTARENIAVTALIGSAAGHKSPDLTGTFEITLAF
jgi:hypothetical protein